MYQLNGNPCFLDVKGDNMGYNSVSSSSKVEILKRPDYVPYFSPYLFEDITYINNSVKYKSLKATLSTLLVKPEFVSTKTIDTSNCKFIFEQFHKPCLSDWFGQENKQVTLMVKIPNHHKLTDLMRDFYYFDNCLWLLAEIKDLEVVVPKLTSCKFIKILNINNYFK